MSEVTEKKRGRGRKPTPQAKKRQHAVTCRLTDAELEHVDHHRGRSDTHKGLTRGEWIRLAALSAPPRIVPELNREAWLELSRVGSNLNQIARVLNTDPVIDPSTVEALARSLREFRLALIGGSSDESQG